MNAAPLLFLASLLAAAEAPMREQDITCLVMNARGQPLASIVVFAARVDSDEVVKVAVSDADGRAVFRVAHQRYNFGLLNPGFGVERLVTRGPQSIALVVRPMPVVRVASTPDPRAAWMASAQAFIVRGRVLDETGQPIGGVRLEAVRPDGEIASSALSGVAGDFALAMPGGRYWLRASAPGLALLKWERPIANGPFTLVMAIAADVQHLELSAGHVLSFRPADSLDPEYYPPAPVLAWLKFSYGICPSADPRTAQQRRTLKKYWWLDVLREAPSSPAQRATFFVNECRPPPSHLELAASWRTENPSGGFGPLP